MDANRFHPRPQVSEQALSNPPSLSASATHRPSLPMYFHVNACAPLLQNPLTLKCGVQQQMVWEPYPCVCNQVVQFMYVNVHKTHKGRNRQNSRLYSTAAPMRLSPHWPGPNVMVCEHTANNEKCIEFMGWEVHTRPCGREEMRSQTNRGAGAHGRLRLCRMPFWLPTRCGPQAAEHAA